MSAYPKVKEWRAKNKEKVNAQAQRYRAKHPETAIKAKAKYRYVHLEEIRKKDAEQARARRANNPVAQRARNLRHRAKILAEKEKIAGRPRPEMCELCREISKTVFDHSHSKGHFRGWICDRCNRVLGSVNDSIELLAKMITYLQNYG